MKIERWQQVDELLEAALERDASDRTDFLKDACEGDEELRLYYSEEPRRAAVMKAPVEGGSSIAVRTDTATRPAISPEGSILYYLVTLPTMSGGADYEIRMASPENGPSKVLARVPARRVPPWLWIDPVISPDGRWLAMPLTDGGTTNIWAISTADGTFHQITDFGQRVNLHRPARVVVIR